MNMGEASYKLQVPTEKGWLRAGARVHQTVTVPSQAAEHQAEEDQIYAVAQGQALIPAAECYCSNVGVLARHRRFYSPASVFLICLSLA